MTIKKQYCKVLSGDYKGREGFYMTDVHSKEGYIYWFSKEGTKPYCAAIPETIIEDIKEYSKENNYGKF